MPNKTRLNVNVNQAMFSVYAGMCDNMCGGRNLLRPAGVQLQPATFKLKVYYAEDLPRSKLVSVA